MKFDTKLFDTERYQAILDAASKQADKDRELVVAAAAVYKEAYAELVAVRERIGAANKDIRSFQHDDQTTVDGARYLACQEYLRHRAQFEILPAERAEREAGKALLQLRERYSRHLHKHADALRRAFAADAAEARKPYDLEFGRLHQAAA